MLTVKWCLTSAGLFLQITRQKPVNRDEDGSIHLWDDSESGYRMESCGGPDWDGDVLFCRGSDESCDDQIIHIDGESASKVMKMIWRYNLETSNNTLDPDDVFEWSEDLVVSYDDINETGYYEDDIYKADKLKELLCL